MKEEGHPELNRTKYDVKGGARYYLQGNLAFLDVPGEYFYHKETGVLYYYPKDDEVDIDEQLVVVPTMQEIIKVKGEDKQSVGAQPDPNKQVHNITFYGLTVKDTDFPAYYTSAWTSFGETSELGYFPPEALEDGITNPSYCEQTERPQFQVGAFTLKDTHNITIDSTCVMNIGMNGIAMFGDNTYNTVQNSEIKNIGFNGVITDGGYPGVGKYNNHHLFTNLLVHDVGELVGQASGVTVQQSGYNTVSHIEVYNSPRRGVFFCGAWWRRHPEHRDTCPPNCKLDAFVRYDDSYTYENHFEYLYIHDCEQDGGDDGALFVSTLFWESEGKGNKPNYIDQVVIGDIAANRTMGDYKPSNMNVDMGCSGLHVSNLKSVNPQQLNIRTHPYPEGEIVTYDNINGFQRINTGFGTNNMWKTFDESRMEYDQIGVTDDFPFAQEEEPEKEYPDLYFRDEFDNGLSEWWSMSGKTETSPVYFSDKNGMYGNSFRADSYWNPSPEGNARGTNIERPFGIDLNKIVEVDFFDRCLGGIDGAIWSGESNNVNLDSFAYVDDGEYTRGIGVDTAQDFNYYVYEVGGLVYKTEILRSAGWHTFKWDYTCDTEVKMYIDDQLIATVPYSESFNTIRIGDFSGQGMSYFDNVVVYGGEDVGEVLPLPPQGEDGGENPDEDRIALPGKIEAEDAHKITGSARPDAVTGGGQCLGYIGVGDRFEYQVEVTEPLQLPLEIQYAANKDGKIKVTIGEESQEVVLPATGGWQNWQSVETPQAFTLEPGEYTIVVDVIANNINLDWFAMGYKEEVVEIEKVSPVVDGTLILSKGNSVKIPCIITPENADNPNVTWSTDDDGKIITVSNDGTITAIGEGTATVTVTSVANEAISASFEVEVQDTEKSLISSTENGCVATVSSYWSDSYKAENLIDNNLNPEWASCRPGYTDPEPTATLTWDKPQNVKEIWLYDRSNTDDWTKEVEVTFNEDPSTTVSVSGLSNDGKTPGILKLDEVKQNITSITFSIDREKNTAGAIGLSEIKVFSETPGEVPVNGITFGANQKSMFVGTSFDLALPQIVPSTATNSSYEISVSDESILELTENSWDGVLSNYRVKALKAGTAQIVATTSNGKKAVLDVSVYTKDDFGKVIFEAQALLSKVPGESSYHKQLRSAINSAVKAYNLPGLNIETMDKEMAKLREAISVMENALTTETNPDFDAVMNDIVIENPELFQEMLVLPEVPFGYAVEVESVSPKGIIYQNGVILIPDTDTEVEISLRVTRLHDQQSKTKTVSVKVQGVSCEDLIQNVEISMPTDGSRKIAIPDVPNGFTIGIIKSSAPDIIELDGSVHYPLSDQEVTLTVEISKLSNQTSVQKDFSFVVEGKATPAEGKFEAESYSEQQGMIENQIGFGNIDNGDWICFHDIYFGDEEKLYKFIINVGIDPSYTGGTFTLKLDSLDGVTVGSITFVSTGGFESFAEQSVTLDKSIKGSDSLYLVAGGRNTGICNFDYFKFEDVTPVETTYQATVENGSGEYEAGTEVTITADEAPEGKVFEKWVSNDVTFADAESETTTFVMPEKDITVTATYRDATSVNKSLLQKTYDYALTLSTEGVTDSAKAYFEKALAEAKAVLDNPRATQEEVDTAWDNLLVGIWGLGLTQGDKTMLEQLITRTDEMIANADKYVQDNWQQLLDALAAAKEVMADGDAMEEDVQPAADSLLEAILAQRYKANKSNLEELINKANGMDLSQYTAESVAVFKAALASANLVLADESLTEDDQSVVDNAVKDLEAAIENLSAAEETPSNPDDPDKGEEGTQTPATGDHSDTAVLFATLFAMMMLAGLVIARQYKKQMTTHDIK